MHVCGTRGAPVQYIENSLANEIDQDPEILAQRTAGLTDYEEKWENVSKMRTSCQDKI